MGLVTGMAGLVGGFYAMTQLIPFEAHADLRHFALAMGTPIVATVAGFVAGGWLSRRLRAHCACGIRARRISSVPAVYRCALGHDTRIARAGREIEGIFDPIRRALDRGQSRALERDIRKASPGDQEGELSIAHSSDQGSDQGSVSLARNAGAVTIADKK